MAELFSIKRGDTWKTFQMVVSPRSGYTLPDPTSATAVLRARVHGTTADPVNMGGTVVVTGTTSEVTLTYTFASGETDTAIDWDVEFKITLSDARIWTVPGTRNTENSSVAEFGRVIVVADLGTPA